MQDYFSKREHIDNVDSKIVELIAQRIELSDKILSIKHEQNIPFEDSERERNIISNLMEKFPDIDNRLIKQIFQLIFHFNKKINQDKFADNINEHLKCRPLVIAGPCTIESQNHIEQSAKILSQFGVKFLRAGAFKPRTSPQSFQGLGDDGIKYARESADEYNMYLVAEVLEIEQLERNINYIDVVQIGSKNMFSYGLMKQIGRITKDSQKPIIVKRGFNATLREFILASDYIRNEGNDNLILCLRGIRTFEQIDSQFRNTPDLASILELRSMTDLPIIFDPSHATGVSKFIIKVARAALNLGADGVMIETHEEPEKAFVDGYQSIKPIELELLLKEII